MDIDSLKKILEEEIKELDNLIDNDNSQIWNYEMATIARQEGRVEMLKKIINLGGWYNVF